MTQTPTDALRLVPVEPTEAMLDAVRPINGLKVWSNMLAAAPASPLPGGLPPISLDGPHEIDFHRQWLARQLLDSKLDDEEAYSIVRHDPAIRLPATPTGDA